MASHSEKPARPGTLRASTKGPQPPQEGFSLIELMIAVALLAIMMAAAFTAVIEAERSANTVAARTTDAATAEPVVNSLARQIRAAQQAALNDATGTNPYTRNPEYTELWLASDSTSDWPYKCTIWAYVDSTHELEAFATATTSQYWPVPLAQTTTPADLVGYAQNSTDGLRVAAQLQGVSPLPSVSGGLFQDFGTYPGLVDIGLQLRYSTKSNQSSIQEATATPVMVEVEADDANPNSGPQNVSTTSPYYPTNCY